MSELQSPGALGEIAARVDAWVDRFANDSELVLAVDRGTSDETSFGEPRWYLRMSGEAKDIITVWLTLGQRTLRYETYVMPAPEENHLAVADQLLRRNDRLVGAHFSIGAEDAIYLRGEIPDHAITDAELDRLVGTLYATVEQVFRSLLQVGFASRFAD